MGYLESQMIVRRPEMYSYLKQFEVPLRNRAAFKKYFESSDPFYTQFNVSSYTFAPYKVVWKRMASDLVAAVISTFSTPFGEKMGIATDTSSLLPFDNIDEAVTFVLSSIRLLQELLFALFHRRDVALVLLQS